MFDFEPPARLSAPLDDIPQHELLQNIATGACHFIAWGRMNFMNACPTGDGSLVR